MTKVTIYIASHNYGHFLKDAIESVFRQTYDNWELLLINDNSSDNTQEIMELYEGDYRVTVFETDGIGLPSVANLALKEAKGEYIIRLDGDDVFDENIILVLTHYLDKHTEDALVFPDYYLVDDDGGIFLSERRAKVFSENHMLDIPAHGACTMIRTSVLKELGGYRVDLGAQDGFDLWSKVIEKYKCGNVNLPLFYYRRHGKNLTSKKKRIFSARRAIKRDASIKKIADVGQKIAVIPCRKFYDIYTDLWKLPFDDAGNTLLDLAIQRCISENIFDEIIVACDNEEVQEIIQKYDNQKIQVYLRRQEDTLRSRPISLALNGIVKQFALTDKDVFVLSYIQAPFSSGQSLEEALHTLVINEADSAFAIKKIEDTVYQRTSNGLTSINDRGQLKADFDILYTDARIATVTTVKNIKRGSLTGARMVHFVVPQDEVFFIKTREDFEIAKVLHAQKWAEQFK